jgi:hypothetical protein
LPTLLLLTPTLQRLHFHSYNSILGLDSTYEKEHMTFVFLSLDYFTNIMTLPSTHFLTNYIISFFFKILINRYKEKRKVCQK